MTLEERIEKMQTLVVMMARIALLEPNLQPDTRAYFEEVLAIVEGEKKELEWGDPSMEW